MSEQQIVMCDRVEGERATMRYVWSWGESGACSAKGQFLINQQAKSLKQSVSFAPLGDAPPAPLERGERVALIARALAAESERDEVNERNSRLYAANTELASQARQLRIRDEASAAEVARLTGELAKVNEAYTLQGLELRTALEQLTRANTLLEAGPNEDEELASLRGQLEAARGRIAELESHVVE
jgi:hypothetical protein